MYFEEYSISGPHYRGHANANTCNHAFGTYLYSLEVTSSLRQIGCLVFPYTQPTRASVNSQGAHMPPGPSGQANMSQCPKVSGTH